MGVPIRLLRCGESAVLVEITLADPDRALAGVLGLAAALRVRSGTPGWPDVEIVPAARTVLVTGDRDVVGLGEHLAEIAEAVNADALPEPTRTVTIDVDYDGPDLAEIARLTGLTEAEVIDAHTGTPWQVGFGGFAPGFAYLIGGDPRLNVPRRSSPRTSVPSGAVGLAGRFSGIYPRASPGGWQLLGRTDAVLWDPTGDPPVLLMPGTQAQFRRVGRSKPPQPPSLSKPSPGSADVGSASRFEVLATGPLAIPCDLGRPGHAAIGVSTSGAADRSAYQLGQRLLGQGYHAAALEVMLGGLALRAKALAWVALTGADSGATLDGIPVGHGASFLIQPGQVLRLGTPTRGLRTYVSVRGGFDLPITLGSRSTDVLSGIGPKPLTAGDTLAIGPTAAELDFAPVDFAPPVDTPSGAALDVIAGPRDDWFSDGDQLTRTTWAVSAESNRVGVRLDGPAIERHPDHRGELPSEGVLRGTVQIPANGRPVVFLADHPVTGGYPAIGVLTAAATDRLAQARPGDSIRFRYLPSRY